MAADPKKPKNSDKYDANESLQQGAQGGSASAADLTDLIARLDKAGGVPISLRLTPSGRVETFDLLTDKEPVTVAFPPCSGEMLALVKTTDASNNPLKFKDKDDIVRYFEEYFRFGAPHVIIRGNLFEHIDDDLLNCGGSFTLASSTNNLPEHTEWLGDCCICSPCLTLDGNRNPVDPYQDNDLRSPLPEIRRLFIGDVVWLSFMERMGIPQILGAILDAFACNGRLPISNGSLDAGIKDDITALVLEVMTRQVKTGMSSTVRDRACVYRTTLGWVSDAGRKLNLDTNVNTGLNTLFHKLIYHSLEFYKDKRLAVAIRGTAAPVAPPSVATLITIRDTIDLLKKRFETFDYGRNYYNTLSGIVWTIAGMSVIRSLATTLGIPPAFSSPDEFIPAAYDILVLKRPVTSGETNRYLVHKECADKGRDILMDLEVINHKDTTPVTGDLEEWLTQVEAKIEGYRTAYRTLTGVDLGVSPNPVIEQQA
jgi:hypothetical protein